MPFVVPNVCRFTVNGTLLGRPVANIIDMQIDTTGSPLDRGDDIFDTCGDILNNWHTQILSFVSNQYQATSVSWVDLDTATGTTGERSSTSAHTWPANGSGTSESYSPGTSILIKKETGSRRGSKAGRMYLAGLTEGNVTGNSLSSGQQAAIQAKFDTLFTNLNDSSGTAHDRNLVVVHILTRGASTRPGRPGPPLTGDWSDLTAFSVQTLLATQRRRLRK